MTRFASSAHGRERMTVLTIAIFVLIARAYGASAISPAQISSAQAPRHQVSATVGTLKGGTVIHESKRDTGPYLREIAPLLPGFFAQSEHEVENKVNPNHNWIDRAGQDPVLQTAANSPSAQSPSFAVEFDGVGLGDGLCCHYEPPDNDGAVGTTQYVQYVNAEYHVFDKSGNSVLGPLAGNAFWSGFGGECESEDNGDPMVRFDAVAQRWVVAQFALGPSYAGPFFECVAVSQTDDATGAYNRYAFPMTDFPDYPKLSVWPDAYYFTFDNFTANGSAYVGVNACAADRTSMLSGGAATMQCFQMNSTNWGMLPADLDGATPPAAGTPNFMMELDPDGSANLSMFQFHVDFATPANSTFTGPTLISVPAFTPLCNAYFRGRCVPQPTAVGNSQLEALGDRLMWRLVYRNFGDHTTLLATHSVNSLSSSQGSTVVAILGGIRWYEIRNPESSPAVFQSGTFAPDSEFRWMPAMAMDQDQDIAVGYSISGAGAGQFPSVAYAGRVPSDPAGTLESEVVMVAGLGSQTAGNRWGDYSSLTVDPTDDCTFWFTEEYLKSDGSWNWSTAIGSFKFAGCGVVSTPTITNLSTNSGPVGTAVTITGTNFGSSQGASTVAFNGTAATSISGWSATSIATAVPSGATTGNVIVTVGGNGSNGVAFTVSVTPAVSWTQPTAITYGATLSGILNASAAYNGAPVAGSFAYTATPSGGSAVAVTGSTVLGAGSYTLNASFTPTDAVTYMPASGTVSLAVGKAAPTVALGSTADTVFAQNQITFTATVSSSVGTPTGTVALYDGSTQLGSAVTLAQGVATYATSSLAVGAHSITAVYAGDANFSTVTSSAASEAIEDFAIAVPSGSSSSKTIAAGGTASYSLQVTPSGGSTFPAQITLSVSGLPTGATPTITPQTAAQGAGQTNVSLSVALASKTASLHRNGLLALVFSPLVAGMLFFGARGEGKRNRGRVLRLMLLAVAILSVLGVTSCGEDEGGPSSHTYTLTMTATSGSLSHSTTLKLTVQ